MGILTSFYAVEEHLFERFVEEERLKDLLDCLDYGNDPSSLGLPAETQLPTLHLDKGWDDIGVLLEGVTLDFSWEGGHPLKLPLKIRYEAAFAFYWPSMNAQDILAMHYALCRELSDNAEAWSSEATKIYKGVISDDKFDESFKFIVSQILKRIAEKTIYSTNNGAFDEGHTVYVFNHYERFIRFLRRVLLPEDGEFQKFAIIGFQS